VLGGKGAFVESPTMPTFAAPPPAFDHVAAGGVASCALASGTMWCWGKDPANGVGATSVAKPVGTLDDWTSISMGFDHGCGLSASQGVLCWGTNNHGQAGDVISMAVTAPQQVAGLPMAATKLVAGDTVTCAILTDGSLWCWGQNTNTYVIDHDVNTDFPTPTQIGAAGGWTSVSPGKARICGVQNGVARCWGTGGLGGLGDGLWFEQYVKSD